MTCLNVVLVISTLTLASHGLFVNNAATKNQVTPSLKQYPVGITPVSLEDLQLAIDLIFGTTPKTTELPPRHIKLICNDSLTSPNENGIPDKLENDSLTLKDNKLKERIRLLFTQNLPFEYKNYEGYLDETTTPAVILTETTESDEYGHTVPLPEEDKNEDENECKQELPPINRAGRRVSNIKCEEHMNHLKYEIIDRNECLRLKGYSQVVGGSQSKEGDFPHMGAVGWSSKNNSWVYMCGSSLISSRFSLTAGHCMARPSRGQIADISDLNPKVVRFGSVSLANNEDTIIMNIEEFIITEEYSKHLHLKYNDIGLIKFTMDVPISQFVRPACLWDGYLRGHLTGNITGWGQTQSDKLESKSPHLLYAEIDYFSKDMCFKLLDHRKNRQWAKGLIDSQFCAGKLTSYVDTCQGDSGGPNQVQEPLPMQSNVPMYYVVGITSFGAKCAEPDIPGIYTNVTQYLCWIEKTVWPDEENQMCP